MYCYLHSAIFSTGGPRLVILYADHVTRTIEFRHHILHHAFTANNINSEIIKFAVPLLFYITAICRSSTQIMEDDSRSEDMFSESSGNDSGTDDLTLRDSPLDQGHMSRHTNNILAKRMPVYILRTSGSSDSEPEEERPPQRNVTNKRKHAARKSKTASTAVNNRTPSRKDFNAFPASKKTRIAQQFLNAKAKDTNASKRKVKIV